MTAYLRQRISERIQQIADLERQIEVAKGELRAYEDALAHSPGGASEASPAPLQPNGRAHRPPTPPSHWPDVIAALAERGDHFTTDDVVKELASRGKPNVRKSVRAKLAEMVNESKITRLSDGVFRVPKVYRESDRNRES